MDSPLMHNEPAESDRGLTVIGPTPESHSPSWAQWVSDVFSPLMMPTYGIVIALWSHTMSNIPADHRIFAALIVFGLTGAVPFLLIAMLIKAGKVTTRSIADRRQRALPMSQVALCYLITAALMNSLGAPAWISMFFVGAAVAVIIAIIITTRWKISAHTTAAGGLVSITLWLMLHETPTTAALATLTVAVLVCGLVATSRLLLDRHSLAQVIAGAALGFASTFTLMYL